VREASTICPRRLQVYLWPFDLESGVRFTCDVGYPCANFSLPMPLCFRLRPDVRDRHIDRRQTDVRRTWSRTAPCSMGGGIIKSARSSRVCLNYISTAQFFTVQLKTDVDRLNFLPLIFGWRERDPPCVHDYIILCSLWLRALAWDRLLVFSFAKFIRNVNYVLLADR